MDGLIVIDMTRVLAGPLTGQMLADMGADVIKVERPVSGDDARQFGPPFFKDADGRDTNLSPMYLSANRNKRSVTLDFSKPEGKDLLLALIAKADVLIENYKVGDLKRFGLDYATLSTRFPKLIYCSITGYGQTGPYSKRPGYDSVFQAESGVMSVTGHPDHLPGGGPMKIGPSIADILTGLYAANAIVSAAYRRDRTDGCGEYIDIALLESMICGLGHFATQYLVTGIAPRRIGSQGNGGVPAQAFVCLDGTIMMTAGNQGQYERFCRAIGRDDLLSDARFLTNSDRVGNRDALSDILSAELSVWKTQALLDALHASNVPAGRVNALSDVFSDPHVQHRNVVQELHHHDYGGVRLVKNPINFLNSEEQEDNAPPNLGEHTETVLRDYLDLDGAALAELKRRNII